MTNILKAIINIVEQPIHKIEEFYVTKNRATSMGKALEEYIKDMFAGTKDEIDEQARLEKFNEVFSYTGNANNPPDIMIRGGNSADAIEVKKIEGIYNNIALNSSFPKSKLYSSSTMISKSCRECEDWTERDILYCIGVVNGDSVKRITIVYGSDYAASSNIYENIKVKIKEGIDSIPDVEFTETNELGKVNKVDPLGITSLRVRGMWDIENPLRVFNYVYTPNLDRDFELMVIINNNKYNSFSETDRDKLDTMSQSIENFLIKDVKIKDPDNPVNLREAKLITYSKGGNQNEIN